ncbi:hypothetical protein EJB05_55794, partial [Eragrostis curvula]
RSAIAKFQDVPTCKALVMDGMATLDLNLSFMTLVFLLEPIWYMRSACKNKLLVGRIEWILLKRYMWELWLFEVPSKSKCLNFYMCHTICRRR